MSETDTFNALIRTPFQRVVKMCYEADPYGTYTFSRMNQAHTWKVADWLEPTITAQGWKIEDFNKELHKKFTHDDEQSRLQQET
jgi:hypothetical protein